MCGKIGASELSFDNDDEVEVVVDPPIEVVVVLTPVFCIVANFTHMYTKNGY